MSNTPAPRDAVDGSVPDNAVASTPAQKTLSLSVRAVAFARGRSDHSKTASAAVPQAHSASPVPNGAIPLKRLTAGRKEMKINHDGATYLLRVTKSNKLILTKEAAAVLAAVTS